MLLLFPVGAIIVRPHAFMPAFLDSMSRFLTFRATNSRPCSGGCHI